MSMADRRLAERQAPLFPVLRDLQRVRMFEQRLGRNAAPVQAGAAERLLLVRRRPFAGRAARREWRPRSRPCPRRSPRRRIRSAIYSSFFLIVESGTKATVAGAAGGRRWSGRRSPVRAATAGSAAGRVVVPQLPVGLGQRLEPARERAAPSASATSAISERHACDNPRRVTTILPYRTACNECQPACRRCRAQSRYNRAPAMAPPKTILICRRRQGMRDTIDRHPQAGLPRADASPAAKRR